MSIPTRRPDDFFAQMAKSDDHMKRVREEWQILSTQDFFFFLHVTHVYTKSMVTKTQKNEIRNLMYIFFLLSQGFFNFFLDVW